MLFSCRNEVINLINRNPSNVFNIDQGLPNTTQINRAHSTEYVREFISLIVGDSLNVWETHALAPNRRFTSRVFVRGVEFTDETIVDFRIEETVNPDDSFMIGSVGATKLELTLLHTEEKPVDAVENAVIRPEIALEVDGEFVYLPMGVYYAEKVDKKKGSIKITAFDSMVKFEKPYISHLTYPTNIQSVAEEICSFAGVTLASTLPNIQINEIIGYTLRQALSFIASFVGGFARFNRDGELEIKGYDTFIEKVYPSNYFDLQTPENTFSIGRLTCKVGENEEGEIIELTTGTDGNEVYFENPIMTQVQLERIYSTLRNINYLPYELNWQGDPALQAGDRIRITDANGVVFESLVMEQQIKYSGGFSATASAKAKTETAQEFSSTGTLTQKVERQEKEIVYTKKEIKRTAEEITSDLNTRIGDVNDNIDSLLSRADGVDGTLVTINEEIDEINGSLSSTITEISNINGVVSEHTTTLEQHAGAIAAKAEKTEVYTKTETNGLLDDKVNVTVYNNKMTALDLTIDGLNTTVSNTVANVDTLTGNVTSALSQIGELDLRADGFETSISEITGDLSGVEGRLTSAEGSITALAGEVALKATQTEVDTIEGRLSTAEGSITTMAGQISSKAEASEVTALGTQITTVEENIDAINGELTNKVSTTDYNGNKIASLINQSATTIKMQASRIEFNGHVFGDGATFKGVVEGGVLRSSDKPNFYDPSYTDRTEITNGLITVESRNGDSYKGYVRLHQGLVTISGVSLWTPTGYKTQTGDIGTYEAGGIKGPGSFHIAASDKIGFGTWLNTNVEIVPHSINPRFSIFGTSSYDKDIFTVASDSTGKRVFSQGVYNRTYSNAPNLFITEYGTIGRSTSATKYKLDIQPLESHEYAERILQLQPKSWYDKATVESYSEYLTKNGNVEIDTSQEDIPFIKRHYGLIAEDLVEAGLDDYVVKGSGGEVEGLEYDRLWTLLIPIVKNLKTEIEQLKEKIA